MPHSPGGPHRASSGRRSPSDTRQKGERSRLAPAHSHAPGIIAAGTPRVWLRPAWGLRPAGAASCLAALPRAQELPRAPAAPGRSPWPPAARGACFGVPLCRRGGRLYLYWVLFLFYLFSYAVALRILFLIKNYLPGP